MYHNLSYRMLADETSVFVRYPRTSEKERGNRANRPGLPERSGQSWLLKRQPWLLRSIEVSSSAALTPVRHTPSKLAMRVRFPSPAPGGAWYVPVHPVEG